MTSQRYRPLYKLDAGGMAEVYVAEAESMAGFKKKVAIKRILPGLIKDQRFVRMFLDEARLSLRLNHANVVSVFDIGESENTYFIVMDFVHGTNLKALLEYQAKRGGAMPVPLVTWILTEILKGLAYAHKLTDSETGRPIGIVHRDISPPNILVSWNGEVKLTDFGLAKATTQLESTDPGVVKGKYSYLSPEAARGEEIDHRADVFSAGILAFEMLTGRRLFRGKNDYQTIALVRACEVPSVRSYNPAVPPELEAVIMRALSKDINDRYADADDFADALLQFLFSNRLKVGARDLIEYCKPIREEIEADKRAQEKKAQEERSPGGNNLIINLINEEMLHFRSLGEGEKPAQEGLASEPVVPVAEATRGSSSGSSNPNASTSGRQDVDPSRPLDVDVFTPVPGKVPLTPNKLGLSPTPVEPMPRRDMSIDEELGLGGSSAKPAPGGPATGKQQPQRTIPPDPRTARPPAPTSKEGGSSWIIVLVLLLVAGGVIAFLVFGM
ncbi:MAG TPA: protein kinase [Nannocystis sp.]|jgi:serine/threonine-protein kinase